MYAYRPETTTETAEFSPLSSVTFPTRTGLAGLLTSTIMRRVGDVCVATNAYRPETAILPLSSPVSRVTLPKRTGLEGEETSTTTKRAGLVLVAIYAYWPETTTEAPEFSPLARVTFPTLVGCELPLIKTDKVPLISSAVCGLDNPTPTKPVVPFTKISGVPPRRISSDPVEFNAFVYSMPPIAALPCTVNFCVGVVMLMPMRAFVLSRKSKSLLPMLWFAPDDGVM